MNFQIIDCEQRSQSWKAARAGRVTGTCAEAILAKGRKAGEESVQRRDLRVRLALERLNGVPIEDGYTNTWMQWGVDKEADAFAAYEAATGHLVRRTGFLAHTELPIGCSLDGDIDEFTGLVSLKAPKSATHRGYLFDPQQLVADHVKQTLHELLVSDAQWSDFVSFDPRYPEPLQLVIVRVTREQAAPDLAAYELAMRQFLREVDDELSALQALLAKRKAA